jgi:hypothetical protein
MFIIMGTIAFLLVEEVHTLKAIGTIHQRVTKETKDIGTKAIALNNVKEKTRFMFND